MPVFPAVVGPKPILWGSEYRLFHQPDVSVGDFEVGTSTRIEFYFPYGGSVISPFYDFDVEVHDGDVEFLAIISPPVNTGVSWLRNAVQ